MGHLPVPWAIDGDTTHQVRHSAVTARMPNYAATIGQEGVLGEFDCRVQALAIPGTSIRAMPGGYAIRNRALAGDYESYMGKITSEDIVGVSATDASGARSDLVVIRIENPYLSGEPWSIPADPENGPYVSTFVIENLGGFAGVTDPTNVTDVSELNLGYSAITLARIDMPMSTGTVIDDYITDLRSIAKLGGRRVQGVIAQDVVKETAQGTNQWNTGAPQLDPADLGFTAWPPSASWDVPVPLWATHVTTSVQVMNAHLLGGDTWGEIRLMIDGVAQSVAPIDLNQDVDSSGGFRSIIPIAGTYLIDPTLRGEIVTFHLESKVYDDARVTGTLYSDIGTTTVLDLMFKQLPIYE